ncbi:MAG: Gfo/Idh/MocA family oxidoreductase [Candidatus Azobacteroides sp.]|nr:Gfo/Idh/MocA family oxidoreductase [Candidatus Azobacteroides sp.]
MNTFNIAIIGTGRMAEKMAATLCQLSNIKITAVASRRMETARLFAEKFEVTEAFDSYEKMLDKENIDLVYIATPHSEHYQHAKACLEKRKPVLCEKAFTMTAREAEELLSLSKRNQTFITEGVWTRYMPLSGKINEVLESGMIGIPTILSANLGYPVAHKERLIKPELGGGALLDLGVYTLNFASMIFGSHPKTVSSSCIKADTGVDAQESITLTFENNKMAVLYSTMLAKTDRLGIISGEKGHVIVENINNPERIVVVNEEYELIAAYERPPQISGYEYEIYACMEAIRNGWLETPAMPHQETLRIMQLMDRLREEWGC